MNGSIYRCRTLLALARASAAAGREAIALLEMEDLARALDADGARDLAREVVAAVEAGDLGVLARVAGVLGGARAGT